VYAFEAPPETACAFKSGLAGGAAAVAVGLSGAGVDTFVTVILGMSFGAGADCTTWDFGAGADCTTGGFGAGVDLRTTCGCIGAAFGGALPGDGGGTGLSLITAGACTGTGFGA